MNKIIKLSSKDNDIIKYINALQKSSKKRREEGVFVLEGQRLCCDALQNGYIPEMFIMSDSASKRLLEDCKVLADAARAVYQVSDALFDRISDTVAPQGILCVCKIPDFSYLSFDTNGKYIALENLQDPSNLGAVARTAEALGIDGIIIQGGCDPYSSKSLRASMGALLRIPIIQSDDMFVLFEKHGLTSYAAVVDGNAERVTSVKFQAGCVAVVGNEGNGLDKATIKKCSKRITIPMNGRAESLNAAVAASIIMWEMCK